MVAVQRDDDIARGMLEASLIAATVAANTLANDLRTVAGGHVCGPVRRSIVDDNHLVDKLRHPPQYLVYTLFLIQTGNDYRDFLVSVQRSQRTATGAAGKLPLEQFRINAQQLVRIGWQCMFPKNMLLPGIT